MVCPQRMGTGAVMTRYQVDYNDFKITKVEIDTSVPFNQKGTFQSFSEARQALILYVDYWKNYYDEMITRYTKLKNGCVTDLEKVKNLKEEV